MTAAIPMSKPVRLRGQTTLDSRRRTNPEQGGQRPPRTNSREDKVTLLVSSADQALLGQVIATTAASMGMEVTLFFPAPKFCGQSSSQSRYSGPIGNDFVDLARERGVRVVAVAVTGAAQTGLADGIEAGNAETYVEAAGQSATTLFL